MYSETLIMGNLIYLKGGIHMLSWKNITENLKYHTDECKDAKTKGQEERYNYHRKQAALYREEGALKSVVPIIVLGTMAGGAYYADNKYNEHIEAKTAASLVIQQEADIAQQNQNNLLNQRKSGEIIDRLPAVAIMGHPETKNLDTTVASLNIPVKTAEELTDSYGKIKGGYDVSLTIPTLNAAQNFSISESNGGWVKSLLETNVANHTGIAHEGVYNQALDDMREQLKSVSGKSEVKVSQGGVDATILIPDAVAYAIKNSKTGRLSPDELKAALGSNILNVTVASVSTKNTTDTSDTSHSHTGGKSNNSGGGGGVVLGPFAVGGFSASGDLTSDTDGTNTGKSETTSAPNFVTGSYTIDLSNPSSNISLLNSIVSAQSINVNPSFNPVEHKKVINDLNALEATHNKLLGNATTLVYRNPTAPSEYNNLLTGNNVIGSKTIIDAYGKNFDEVRKEVKKAEEAALKSGNVPVLVGVSYPDEIMNAQRTSKSFDPSDLNDIKKAMGNDKPFQITINHNGKVNRVTVTQKEFANHLPEKVADIIRLSMQQQQLR